MDHTLKIGFEANPNQGPGIFMTRLKEVLEQQNVFTDTEPDVWINLSFQPVPDWVTQRIQTGHTRLVVRMDGAYCGRWTKIRKPFTVPLPFVDHWYSAKKNAQKNHLITSNLHQADHIIFQSNFSRRITQRFVTQTSPGTIIFNGVDLTQFCPEGPRCAWRQQDSSDTYHILMSHHFRPYHRLHDALNIIAALKTRLPVHLHLLGNDDGTAFAYGQSIANRLNLVPGKDFTLHGKQPFDQLAAFYRSCDIMLNLSYWDTCPNVVIEALACGLPVVGVNHGGVAELVGDNGGILVAEKIPFTYIDHLNPHRMPKSPINAYAHAVEKLLSQLPDAKPAARHRAEQLFDLEHTAQAYIETCRLALE